MLNFTRQQSIRNLFIKYENEPSHAHQVKKLALIIFDELRGLIHNMSDNERAFLEAAAILHDIGYYICAKGHNKNSYKLIMQENLSGFSSGETAIIANITRYHRGKLPKSKHSCYSVLPEESKKSVNKLAAFLRIADAFDGSHYSVVDDFYFEFDSFSNILSMILKLNRANCSFEILKAEDKKNLFEKEFGIKLKFIK